MRGLKVLALAAIIAAGCSDNTPDIVLDGNGHGTCKGDAHAPDGLRWRSNTVTYCVDTESFGRWGAVVEQEMSRAWAKVSAVGDVTMVKVSCTAEPNLRIMGGKLDGRGGTLAVAYQAAEQYTYMDDHVLMTPPFVGDIVFDLRDGWNRTMIAGVGLHEGLHGLGVGHSPNKSDVMSPAYRGVLILQPWDRYAVIERYGAKE